VTRRPTTRPPVRTTAPPTTPTRDRVAPQVTVAATPPSIAQANPPSLMVCAGQEEQTTATVTGNASDATDPAGALDVTLSWSLNGGPPNAIALSRSGDSFSGSFRIPYVEGQEEGGSVVIRATAVDPAGNSGAAQTQISLCTLREIIIG
jgi:hypothetical protein